MHSLLGNGPSGSDYTNATSSPDLEPLKPGIQENFLVVNADSRSPSEQLFRLLRYGALSQTTAPAHELENSDNIMTWQKSVSMFAMHLLRLVDSPLRDVGRIIEVIANTIVANGGLMRTLIRLPVSAMSCFHGGPLIVPAKDSLNYSSLIGLLDPRTNLLVKNIACTQEGSSEINGSIFPGPDNRGSRAIVEVLLMASKLAYENEAIIKNAVTSWKMNLVGYYSCWNEFQQRLGTGVFVFTDELQNANAVVVSWKGTDPFNSYDWSTDIDFSWYDLEESAGKVHLGFLEALGLGDRKDMDTFSRMHQNSLRNRRQNMIERSSYNPSDIPASGLPQTLIDAPEKKLAYDEITKIVKELLRKNPSAKLFITGHSLGGSLALLYTGLLYYFEENTVTARIGGLYTFGQPRVGDEEFGKFMQENLKVENYYRMVYCNDIVPRIPFDNELFEFKHWGSCFYFNSLYQGQTLREAPNKNYFYVSDLLAIHINAVYELVNSFLIKYKFGPEYRESTTSTIFRVIALFLPGLGSHSPVNYVNTVRLGKPFPFNAEDVTEEIDKTVCSRFHSVEKRVRDFFHYILLGVHRSLIA